MIMPSQASGQASTLRPPNLPTLLVLQVSAEQGRADSEQAFIHLEAAADSPAALARATSLLALALKGHLRQSGPNLKVQSVHKKHIAREISTALQASLSPLGPNTKTCSDMQGFQAQLIGAVTFEQFEN